MEPSELHMHERSRAGELAASPLTFSRNEEETEMRCVRCAHGIFSASRRVDLRREKEAGAGCVLTGISGGWI